MYIDAALQTFQPPILREDVTRKDLKILYWPQLPVWLPDIHIAACDKLSQYVNQDYCGDMLQVVTDLLFHPFSVLF